MRKVIVSNIVSLDGYYTDVDGNPPFAAMDEAFDAYNLERIETAGTVLLGRASFHGFGAYWPFIADAPEGEGDRSLSRTNRAISRRYTAVEKVVVSDTARLDRGHPWSATTTVVGRQEVGAWVEHARSSGNGDILIFGSRTLWNSLLAAGLVDELHLMIGPVALTGGAPAFSASQALRLADTRRFEGSDNVLLRYLAGEAR